MYRLINQFAEINNYGASEEYLITSGKQTVTFYHQNDFGLIGTLMYQRFPKILKVGRGVLLQDQTRIITLDYSLRQNMSYQVVLEDVSLIDVVDDNVAIIKQGPDASGFYSVAKYALREAKVIWQARCSNYIFRFFNTQYILLDADESRSLINLDADTGTERWKLDVNTIFSKTYGTEGGEYTMMEDPRIIKSTVVIQVQQLNSGKRFVAGLDCTSGELKWYYAGLSNIELYEDHILGLNYDGLLRKLTVDTGTLFDQYDLSKAFHDHQIHCEHRFHVTKTHLYFKHAIADKIGILELNDMQLEVVQLPKGNTMSTSEVPLPIGDRMYVRSAPRNNLFVYESSR